MQEVKGIIVQRNANRKTAVGVVAALLASLAFMTPAAHAASGATSPGAPTGLTPTPGNTSIALSWTARGSEGGSGILGYNVYEGTSPGGESAAPVNGTVPVTTTSYIVTGLTTGTVYYFTVKAVNAYGPSAASNEASATPVATAPDPPRDLTATPGNTSVALTWTAPGSDGGSAILGYNVYEGTTPGGESTTPVNGTALVTLTSCIVTDLATGTLYYFTVTAVNACGVLGCLRRGLGDPCHDRTWRPGGPDRQAGQQLGHPRLDRAWLRRGLGHHRLQRLRRDHPRRRVGQPGQRHDPRHGHRRHRDRPHQRHPLLLHRACGELRWVIGGFQRGFGYPQRAGRFHDRPHAVHDEGHLRT